MPDDTLWRVAEAVRLDALRKTAEWLNASEMANTDFHRGVQFARRLIDGGYVDIDAIIARVLAEQPAPESPASEGAGDGPLAQSVEQRAHNPTDAGSIPAGSNSEGGVAPYSGNPIRSPVSSHPKVAFPSATDFDPALDEGIAAQVMFLVAHGIETFESCEGTEGHAYAEPTIAFHGDSTEGYRAAAVALRSLPRVRALRRVWVVQSGELVGPRWELVFWPVEPRKLCEAKP